MLWNFPSKIIFSISITMSSLFITSEPKYWNKGVCSTAMTLDSYFRVSRKNDSYLPLNPRYLNAINQPQLSSALINKVNDKKMTNAERNMLSECLCLVIESQKQTKDRKYSIDSLFQLYLSWMGPQFTKHKIRGELKPNVVKPFLKVYSLLKRDQQSRVLKVAKNNEKEVLKAINKKFQEFHESHKSENPASDNSDNLQAQYYSQSRSKEQVLAEVDKIMKGLSQGQKISKFQKNAGFDGEEWKSKQKSVHFGKSTKNIGNEFSSKSINSTAKKANQTRTTAKKVKFNGEENDDNEESLCRELQLLINKTNEILNPKKSSNES